MGWVQQGPSLLLLTLQLAFCVSLQGVNAEGRLSGYLDLSRPANVDAWSKMRVFMVEVQRAAQWWVTVPHHVATPSSVSGPEIRG